MRFHRRAVSIAFLTTCLWLGHVTLLAPLPEAQAKRAAKQSQPSQRTDAPANRSRRGFGAAARPGDPQAITRVRERADAAARGMNNARAKKTKVAARRYVERRLERDARSILRALEKVRASGEIDAVAEHRAVAALGRMILAADKVDPKLVEAELRDAYTRLYGDATHRRRQDSVETAVEIEAPMTDAIIDALTTPDGTVKAILEEGRKPPPAFLGRLAGSGDPKSVRWDDLGRPEKLELLRSQSEGHYFFASRKIPGVVFRRDISTALMEKVEFRGPKDVDRVSGVEMHIRQPGAASRNAREAFAIADRLETGVRQGHMHVPAKILPNIRRGDALARAKLVDFYRRVNLIGELRVVRDGFALRPVKDGPITYFDFLSAAKLERLNFHLANLGEGGNGVLGESEMKMGAVGFRPGQLYGDPQMFGFEIRVLNKRRAQGGDPFVDAVQKGVLAGGYDVQTSRFESWHKRKVGTKGVTDQGRELALLHYNRPIAMLIDRAPSTLRRALTAEAIDLLRDKAENHYGLKMLVHRWNDDPILRGDKDALARVVQAQRKGLRDLVAGERPDSVVKDFALNSGIYEVYARSIGINP